MTTMTMINSRKRTAEAPGSRLVFLPFLQLIAVFLLSRSGDAFVRQQSPSAASSNRQHIHRQQQKIQHKRPNELSGMKSLMSIRGTYDEDDDENDLCSSPIRRRGIQRVLTTAATSVPTLSLLSSITTTPVQAAEFAPGGTLVEYDVGVTAGNNQASKSRKVDNSNVVFSQDSYFKFGRAQPFIPSGSTEFPKTVPFTRIPQRYETYKKYKDRVQRGIDLVVGLKEAVNSNTYGDILDGSAPEYSIRPMGLLANGFLASENTGTTNELLLARWYINEVALDISDIKSSSSQQEARESYDAAMAALNSYIGLINRCITSKVGDPFPLVL